MTTIVGEGSIECGNITLENGSGVHTREFIVDHSPDSAIVSDLVPITLTFANVEVTPDASLSSQPFLISKLVVPRSTYTQLESPERPYVIDVHDTPFAAEETIPTKPPTDFNTKRSRSSSSATLAAMSEDESTFAAADHPTGNQRSSGAGEAQEDIFSDRPGFSKQFIGPFLDGRIRVQEAWFNVEEN
jgi:hypothetical protein